jgi:hypothetical protein
VSLESRLVFVAAVSVEDEAELPEISLSPVRDGIMDKEFQNE